MKTVSQGPGKTYFQCTECDRVIEGPRDRIKTVVSMHMRYSHPEVGFHGVHVEKLPNSDNDVRIGTKQSSRLWEEKVKQNVFVWAL